MNQETFEALNTVLNKTHTLMVQKYGNRKRLNQNELWEQAVLTRDILYVRNWMDEVAKEQ